MSWIDIIILALIVLCGLFGVLRGFKKSILSVGAFFVAFILAFFLANVVAEAMLGIDGVKNFVLGNGVGEDAGWSLANMLYGAFSNPEVSIPGEGTFLYNNFYKPVYDIVGSVNLEIDFYAGVSIYYAFLIFSAICGVGIFLVARFLLIIVTVIIGSFIGKKKTWLSRLLGFVVGAGRGAIWSLAITLVFSCFCGLTFIPAFGKIEAEYEPPTAVVSQYFNNGAYAIRNKLFLPNADMYGRVANLVIQKEEEVKPDLEPLTRKRLDLYVNLQNLNYENQPWSVDENNRRAFDEADAKKLDPSVYAPIGFDEVLKAIMDYNAAAAETVNDVTKLTDVTDEKYDEYNGFIQTNSTSVYVLTNNLNTSLKKYLRHYNDGLAYTDEEQIRRHNNTLNTDFNEVRTVLSELLNQYDLTKELLGDFPDISDLIPTESKTAGGGGSTPAE